MTFSLCESFYNFSFVVVTFAYFFFFLLHFCCPCLRRHMQKKKKIAQTNVRVLPIFSCWTFMVSGLTLNSFWGFFFIWCKKVVQFNSFACSSLVFHLLKRLYFPHYIDCISIGLFLGSLLCSIDLCICFCVSTILYFDYSSFIVNLKSGSMIPLALLFSLKIALAIRGLLWFSYKF